MLIIINWLFSIQVARYVYLLTVALQLFITSSYRPPHVPIHRVFTSVAFVQAASNSRVDRTIAQGPHMVSVVETNPAVLYKSKITFKN